MINLHESMGPGRDRTHDPWICSQTALRGPVGHDLLTSLNTRGEFNNASARRALVDWYLSLFIMCKAWHQYNERPRALALLNSPQSNFAISRGIYIHETSHPLSFAKIKPSRKLPNLHLPIKPNGFSHPY